MSTTTAITAPRDKPCASFGTGLIEGCRCGCTGPLGQSVGSVQPSECAQRTVARDAALMWGLTMRCCASIVPGWRPGRPRRCTNGEHSWPNRSSESSRSNWELDDSCCVALPTCRPNGWCWPPPSTCAPSGKRGAPGLGCSLNHSTARSLAPFSDLNGDQATVLHLQSCVSFPPLLD